MNPMLILGPIGMIFVGFFSIGIWRVKKHVKMRYFLIGGFVWVAAILPKLAMDYTVTPRLYEWATTTYGFLGISIIAGTYVGLRTGAFECGFTYLAFSKGTLSKMSVDEATAFGIGFGAFEAILIAVPSMIQIAAFILNPALLSSIPSPQREMLEAQLGLPTWIVPASIIERIFTMFAHVFAALLVFISFARRKLRFFLEAFFYKSLLDAAVPYIQVTLKPSVSPTSIYLGELWVVAMGLIALGGTRWARKTMFKNEYSHNVHQL